MITDLE